MKFNLPGEDTPKPPKLKNKEIHSSNETLIDKIKMDCVRAIADIRKRAPEMPEIDEYLRPLITNGTLLLRPGAQIWDKIREQINSEEGLVTPTGYIRFAIADLIKIPGQWYEMMEAYREAMRKRDLDIAEQCRMRDEKLKDMTTPSEDLFNLLENGF